MSDSASVHSLEALRDWYASLCVFRVDAVESLSAINMEIQRSDAWLDDYLRHWQREKRYAEEELLRAKNELANRQIPNFNGRIPDCSVQEENLAQAERRLEFIHDQIDVVRRWMVRLPKLIDEAYLGPARHLMNLLEIEMPRGIALLKNQIGSLESYLNIKTDQVPSPPPAAPTNKETT